MDRTEICKSVDEYAALVPASRRRRRQEAVVVDKKTAIKKTMLSVLGIMVVVVCNFIIQTM